MSSGLRARLRAETRADHDITEAAFARFDIRTAEGLAGFLAAHHRATGAVLDAIEGQLPDGFSPPPDARAMLAADLAALGHGVPPPMAPVAATAPAAPVGLIYVLAGSRLGNQMIRRNWSQSDDMDVRAAGAYFGARGLDDHARGFLRAVDAGNGLDADAVVAAAHLGFRTFARAAEMS
ncbi:MAG: hypothetical protein AAGD40_08910 [Pseudomonadota bacterium]